MRKSKWLNLLIAGVLLLCACQAPQGPAATPAAEQPTPAATTAPEKTAAPVRANFTDMLGRGFAFAATPQRVVSLSPAGTEILFALGKGSSVIAVDNGSDYPAEAQQLPKLKTDDVEGIAALSPDMVFIGQSATQETIKALEGKGLLVVCAEAASYNDLFASIALMAQVMDTDAAPLVQSIQEAVRDASAKTAELDTQPTVYFAAADSENGHVSAGPGSIAYSIIQMAGGVPVTAAASEAYPVYTSEELAALAPQVVLVSSKLDIDALYVAEGYKDLTAVQEGRVYAIDDALINRPGPRVAEGMQAVYEALELSLNS